MSAPTFYYRNSSATRPPLRIGLLLDSQEKISASFARIIADIKASNFTEIELLVVRTTTPAPDHPPNSGALRFLRSLLNPNSDDSSLTISIFASIHG